MSTIIPVIPLPCNLRKSINCSEILNSQFCNYNCCWGQWNRSLWFWLCNSRNCNVQYCCTGLSRESDDKATTVIQLLEMQYIYLSLSLSPSLSVTCHTHPLSLSLSPLILIDSKTTKFIYFLHGNWYKIYKTVYHGNLITNFKFFKVSDEKMTNNCINEP